MSPGLRWLRLPVPHGRNAIHQDSHSQRITLRSPPCQPPANHEVLLPYQSRHRIFIALVFDNNEPSGAGG